MKKVIKIIKKNYIYINIAFMLLAICVILFPFFSKILEKINPLLVRCPYLMMTGKPCPLCGGTRYISGLFNVFKDIRYLFHPFGIIIIVVISELIFRIYNIVSKKHEKSDRYIKIDIIISAFIIICFFTYEIVFIIIR